MELHYLPDLAFENRIDRLKEAAENAWEFFINSFLNNLLTKGNYYSYFELHSNNPTEDPKEMLRRLFELLKEKRLKYPPLKDKESFHKRISDFYKQELKNTAKKTLKKVSIYNIFLKGIEPEFKIFLFLYNRSFYSNRAIRFKYYAEPKLGSDFVDLHTLENDLLTLFDRLDKYYFEELLYREKIPLKIVKRKLNEKFDFEQYASPIIFIEYPKELAIYKRLLKNWLLMEIEKRKREFMSNLKEFPKIYSIITDFADRLLDPTEQDFLTIQTPEYYQYPNYIFKGFKGYKLFEEYAQNMVSQTQLTFLYRYMKETERDDFKIIADPAVFLDWFDNQKYSSNVYEIKNSLSKVKTKERVHNYELTKKLINKLYVAA